MKDTQEPVPRPTPGQYTGPRNRDHPRRKRPQTDSTQSPCRLRTAVIIVNVQGVCPCHVGKQGLLSKFSCRNDSRAPTWLILCPQETCSWHLSDPEWHLALCDIQDETHTTPCCPPPSLLSPPRTLHCVNTQLLQMHCASSTPTFGPASLAHSTQPSTGF